MTEAGAGTDRNVCYRHPDRRSFVLCQRCGRTVCAQCQTPAAVGVHCPECRQQARAAAPKRPPAFIRAFRRGGSTPVVTYTIIALTLAVFLAQVVVGSPVTNALGYAPPLTTLEPWRMLTVSLVHSPGSFFHILFNMYALFVLGPLMEGFIGRARFLAVYVLSTLGGSVAVLLLQPLSFVVGASGAIFGLFGAFFIIERKLGGTSIQLAVLLAINLALGFVIPGISWQAHVGGLLVGALCAFVMIRTRRPAQQKIQALLLGAIGVALIVVTIAATSLF